MNSVYVCISAVLSSTHDGHVRAVAPTPAVFTTAVAGLTWDRPSLVVLCPFANPEFLVPLVARGFGAMAPARRKAGATVRSAALQAQAGSLMSPYCDRKAGASQPCYPTDARAGASHASLVPWSGTEPACQGASSGASDTLNRMGHLVATQI